MTVIGMGIWAFVVYLTVVIVWSTPLKRSMTESMFVGLLVIALFNGIGDYPQTLIESVQEAATEEVFVATMLFVVMASIMSKTDIITQLVTILNSLIGKLRGGSAYVSTVGSGMFGVICPNSVANSATIGSITIPWMIKSGWSKEMAAVINAGNSGSGLVYPASSCMFLLLGLPQVVAAGVGIQKFYFTMLAVGTWCVIVRLLTVRFFVAKHNIQAVSSDEITPFKQAFRENWKSLLMFISIIIPLVLTLSPLAKVLEESAFGKKGVQSIHILVWVPVLICLICILEGRKNLPKRIPDWVSFIKGISPSIGMVGGIFLFALAGSNVLSKVGFGDDLNALVQSLDLPKLLIILLMAVAVVLVAGPLSGLATTVAMGPVTFSVLTGIGIHPSLALAAFLVWMSTEGASPPSSASIFLSCALGGVKNVQKTFIPLIVAYVLPAIIVGTLIALGYVPIPV